MTPTLIILMLAGTAVTVIGGVLANWLDKPEWVTPRQVMAALAVIVVAATAVAVAVGRDDKDPGPGESLGPSVNSSPSASPSASPSPSSSPGPSPAPSRGPSKVVFLAAAEKLCGEDRGDFGGMPDRRSDPQAFGTWLTKIASSNQRLLEDLVELDRPAADESTLTDLFAQRSQANNLYLTSAGYFTGGAAISGEQFLADAADLEDLYRRGAKEYGFRICVGSDTPGR